MEGVISLSDNQRAKIKSIQGVQCLILVEQKWLSNTIKLLDNG